MQGPTSQLPSYSSSVDPPPAYKAKKRDVKSNPDVVGFGAAGFAATGAGSTSIACSLVPKHEDKKTAPAARVTNLMIFIYLVWFQFP